MAKIKEFLNKIDMSKLVNILAIAFGAIATVYSIYFFATSCFDFSKSKLYNLYFGIILFLMIGMTAYLLRILLTDREFKYTRVYLVLAIGWCTIAQLAMPPMTGVEEVYHYMSAYHASDIIMGYEDQDLATTEDGGTNWDEENSYFYIRKEDINSYATVDLNFPDEFEIIADGNWFHCSEEGQELTACHRYPATWYRYIFSGLGITIARLLKWGFMGTIFLGRFMNSLSLILAGLFAIKLMPKGKLQVISFSLLPTVLELCNSYSYDNMSIIFSMLLFALCMYYSQDSVQLHSWDLIILCATAAILIPNKVAYGVFVIWILCIPLKKWWQIIKSKKWYEYTFLAAFVAAAVGVFYKVVYRYFWLTVVTVVWKSDGVGIEQDASRESFSFHWILYSWENVVYTIKFSLNGIKEDFWYNIKHIIGCELGYVYLNIPVHIVCTVLLIIILFLGLFVKRGKGYKKRQIIWALIGGIVCLVVIFIGCLIRFTPLNGSTRVQISYRYLIPIYMSFFFLAGSDAEENKYSLALIYAQNITLIFVICYALNYLLSISV